MICDGILAIRRTRSRQDRMGAGSHGRLLELPELDPRTHHLLRATTRRFYELVDGLARSTSTLFATLRPVRMRIGGTLPSHHSSEALSAGNPRLAPRAERERGKNGVLADSQGTFPISCIIVDRFEWSTPGTAPG